MNMAVIQMPGRNGQNETGMITKWHKKTGDWIAEGDELFSFDTDDGSYTVKSQRAGRLVAIFVPEGELVHCPADVGMLASPAPDSALRVGQMQFLNPDVPAIVPQFDEIVKGEEEPAQNAPAEEESTKAATEESAAPEAEAPENDAAEVEEEPSPAAAAEEETPAGEISAEEAPEAAEETPAEEPAGEATPAEPDADEAESTAEEENTEEAESSAEEESTKETESSAEEESTEEAEAADDSAGGLPACEEELLDQLPTEDADALDEAEALELPADEPAEVSEESAETEEAAPAANAPAPVESAAPTASPRPASLTAEVDLTVCGELLSRTAATLPALVRFAAMHTDDAALLDPVADGGLRALSACAALPNVDDLSGLGVVAASRSVRGLRFLVPDAHEAFTVQDGALTSCTALNLTLAFDENDVPFDAAARLLRQTAAHLENLFDLLI